MGIKVKHTLTFVLALTVAGPTHHLRGQAAAPPARISPSAVADAFWLELLANPDSQQTILARHASLVVVDTISPPASRLERLAIGETVFLSFRPPEADFYFRGLLEGDDLISRFAHNRLMQVRMAAFGDSAGMRDLYDPYYRRFPPSPLDIFGRYQQTVNLMTAARNAGQGAAAIDLLMRELAALPDDAPYQSYLIPVLFFDDLVAETPAGERVVQLIRTRLPGLRATLARWRTEESSARSDPQLSAIMPSWYWRSQRIRPGETFREARARQLAAMVSRLEAWLVMRGAPRSDIGR